MGLPVLNFKFLPDRCHWERNSSCLQWQEGGGRGGPWPPLTLRSCNLLVLPGVTLLRCGGLALYSLQSSFQTHNLTSCSSLGAKQGCTFPSHGVGGSER